MSEMVHIGEGSCSLEHVYGGPEDPEGGPQSSRWQRMAFDRLGTHQGGQFGANPNAALD